MINSLFKYQQKSSFTHLRPFVAFGFSAPPRESQTSNNWIIFLLFHSFFLLVRLGLLSSPSRLNSPNQRKDKREE